MAKLITSCPSCQASSVRVTKMECRSCGTRFEGEFEVPRLLRLAPDELHFVEQFLLSSGSLKEMAEKLGVSYPTVRNRLNEIIDAMEKLRPGALSEREKILAALEKGTISAKDAARKLRED